MASDRPAFIPRLHRAAARGEDSKVRQFLKVGDNINFRDALAGRTPILCSVYHDNLKCAEILLAAGADQCIRDNDQFFPLYIAAQHNNIPIAKALIEAGADIHAIIDRPDAGSAVYVAVFNGHTDMVKFLLDEGCSVSKKSTDGRHLLTTACLRGHTEIVTILLNAGADPNKMGSDQCTPLIAAAQVESSEIIELLLKRGANVHQPEADGRTVLHKACFGGNTKCVYAILRVLAQMYRQEIIRVVHHFTLLQLKATLTSLN